MLLSNFLGVINSHSTGIGGGGFMMVYNKKKEKGEVIDFREAAPRAAHPNLFKGDAEKGIRGNNDACYNFCS